MKKLENSLVVFRVTKQVTIGIKELSPGDFIAVRLTESEKIDRYDMSLPHEVFLVQFGGALKIAHEPVIPYFSKLETVKANAA